MIDHWSYQWLDWSVWSAHCKWLTNSVTLSGAQIWFKFKFSREKFRKTFFFVDLTIYSRIDLFSHSSTFRSHDDSFLLIIRSGPITDSVDRIKTEIRWRKKSRPTSTSTVITVATSLVLCVATPLAKQQKKKRSTQS